MLAACFADSYADELLHYVDCVIAMRGQVGDTDARIFASELYRSLDAEGRRSITGLQPARAEVILAGACIVRTIIDKLQCEHVTVSDHGLRHGVRLERYGTGER